MLSPISYRLSEGGISATYVNGTVSSAWSLVTGASESVRYVFVHMQRGSFHLVPKQQVDSQQLAALRGILHRKLGTKAKLTTKS